MFSRNRPAVFLSLAVLLSSLTACTNNPSAKNLEQSLAADPQLQNDPVPFGTPQSQPVTPNPNTSIIKLPQVTSSDNPEFIGPLLPKTNNTNVVTQPTTQAETLASQEFTDIQKAPPEWRSHIQDLATLGILSIEPKTNEFLPDQTITRREYARWLVAANNAMYANNPAKQIRLASTSTQPAFRDILTKDPDFPVIQGLAEAGLLPSALSGDATAVLFRPDAPLTREQLILWKVPLDTRQALPAANLEAVKQTWGFQDAGSIEPKALRAVLADFQNAEQSNIRRVFGYTTLFQPKKPVTRAEASAALWYFGTQGEGMSATEALKLKS